MTFHEPKASLLPTMANPDPMGYSRLPLKDINRTKKSEKLGRWHPAMTKHLEPSRNIRVA